MNDNPEASLYWIHLDIHTDPESEGYVGVSKNPTSRIATHLRRAEKGNHHNSNLIETVKTCGKDSMKSQILFSGTEADCYDKEFLLRPTKNIGWNITEGGRMGSGAPYGVPKNREKLNAKKAEREKTERERNDRIASGVPTTEDLAYLKKIKDQMIRHKKRLLGLAQAEHLPNSLVDIRPMCSRCNKEPCAINYIRKEKTHYRKICDSCGKQKINKKPKTHLWEKAGYKKKLVCECCGFKAAYPTQILVFHIDGDLTNVSLTNLRSICLNCVEVVKRKEITWKRGDLLVDWNNSTRKAI